MPVRAIQGSLKRDRPGAFGVSHVKSAGSSGHVEKTVLKTSHLYAQSFPQLLRPRSISSPSPPPSPTPIFVASMALKRKFDLSFDDSSHLSQKQLRLCATVETMESDVAMSEAPCESSGASPSPSIASLPSPQYPIFQIYPKTPDAECNSPSEPFSSLVPNQNVGLLQPTGFAHTNGTCTQIPKLRVACESGPGGRRTMWSFCEECGAVALLE